MPPSPHQSLHQLSVENSWFAARPLFWTSQHLDLLGVRFLHIDGPLNAPQPRGDDAAELDAEALFDSSPSRKLTLIPLTRHRRTNLVCLNRYIAKFFYAGRPVHQTLCFALHVVKPSPQTQPPVIGCTYYRAFLRERRRRYTPPSHPQKDVNSPVKRLCDFRLRKIIPENWAEDPYIVCLLLSLAQAQAIKQKGAMPETFPVRLLVAFDGDKNFAHVFQADIDARILQALNEPRFNLNGITWPNVTHTKVAFDPYLTFPHRLVAEMLGSYMEHM
ncbi:hypothetical protein LB505_010526 [Fusarium chuoi]|nr:hypothetical protein LB505_010526 [Fusarium chuoi]